MGMLCLFGMAKAQDITVFNFDGVNADHVFLETWNGTWPNTAFAKVANPDASGINTSANVGKFISNGGANAELFSENVGTNLGASTIVPQFDFTATPYFSLKVWVNKPVSVSVEFRNDGYYPGFRTKTQNVTTINKWVIVEFNCSNLVPGDDPGWGTYDRIGVSFDKDLTGGTVANDVYYFDDMKLSTTPVNYEFTGATNNDPTVSTNWVGGYIPQSGTDLTVSGGNLILDQNATYNSITVNPAAKLTLNDAKSLTVSTLLLKSDATGTATFVDKNSTPSTISATVQQYLPATDRNWYVSSPIASATSGNLNTGASVVEYNEQLGTWPTVSGTLNPMKGYISTAGSAGTGTLSFAGNLNNGPQSITLSSVGSTKIGYNLVGNPYPSYLNWTEALATSANCLPTIWYKTKSAGAYAFQTYNAPSGIGVPSSTNGYIPPMQGFWVRTSADGSTLSVNNSMRSHGDGASNLLKAPSASKTTGQLVRLQVSNGSNSDETVIYSNQNADNGFDNYDSPKMSSNNANIPEIFTTAGTEKLVINGLKNITEGTEIPLGFVTGTSNDFSLAATELKNLESGMHIILKDNLLNTESELTEGITYNFSSEVTTPNTGRFALIFRTTGATTGVSKTNLHNAQAFVNSANKIVIATSKNCNYSIYNSVGQKVNGGLTSSNPTIVPGSYKAGVYVVNLSEGGLNYCSKVIIK